MSQTFIGAFKKKEKEKEEKDNQYKRKEAMAIAIDLMNLTTTRKVLWEFCLLKVFFSDTAVQRNLATLAYLQKV